MNRRTFLLSLSTTSVAACGFELRQAPKLPFRSIALVGFAPASPLAEALRQQLAGSPVQLL
jgi:LPS-assembly lipoprotein